MRTGRGKAWWLLVAVGALAIGAALGFVLVQLLVPSTPASSTTPGSQVLEPGVARTLEADLSSGDVTRIRKALAIPDGEKLDASLLTGIASLGHITIREDTAVRLDDDSIQVYAGVENGDVKTWTLLLTRADDGWRVASTLEGER